VTPKECTPAAARVAGAALDTGTVYVMAALTIGHSPCQAKGNMVFIHKPKDHQYFP